MTMRLPALARLVCILAALAAGCARSRSPDVVLVIVDTLRADHLGSYGYTRPTSPNLDALARRGLRFAHAEATTSWTAPSVVSILTGLYPAVHGVEKAASVLGKGVPTMAESFRQAGYVTAAIAANPVFVAPRMGIDRGFDSFAVLQGPVVDPDAAVKRIPLDPEFRSWVAVADAPQVTDAALTWLEQARRQDRPYFLFLHYVDPHADYFPPAAIAERFGVPPDAPLAGVAQRPLLNSFRAPPEPELSTLVALYDAEIAYADIHIGRLLDSIEQQGRPTLIVVTADHGEEFGDHGGMMHGVTLYQEQLHVPLIMAGAGVPRGAEIASPVSLSGLWSTIAELAGTAPPPAASGASFAALLRGEKLPQHDLFADLNNSDQPLQHHRAVLDGDWKLIERRNGGRKLFDLARDAGEHADLARVETERAGQLASRLAARAAQAAELRAQAAPATIQLSPEDRARMHALGYAD